MCRRRLNVAFLCTFPQEHILRFPSLLFVCCYSMAVNVYCLFSHSDSFADARWVSCFQMQPSSLHSGLSKSVIKAEEQQNAVLYFARNQQGTKSSPILSLTHSYTQFSQSSYIAQHVSWEDRPKHTVRTYIQLAAFRTMWQKGIWGIGALLPKRNRCEENHR